MAQIGGCELIQRVLARGMVYKMSIVVRVWTNTMGLGRGRVRTNTMSIGRGNGFFFPALSWEGADKYDGSWQGKWFIKWVCGRVWTNFHGQGEVYIMRCSNL